MDPQRYVVLHRYRAEYFEREAAVTAATRRLREARRLERTARLLDRAAELTGRLAQRFAARARASRARLLQG